MPSFADLVGCLGSTVWQSFIVVISTTEHGKQNVALLVEVMLLKYVPWAVDADFVRQTLASSFDGLAVVRDQHPTAEHQRIAILGPGRIDNTLSLQRCAFCFGFRGCLVVRDLEMAQRLL